MAPLVGGAAGALFPKVPDGQNTLFVNDEQLLVQTLTNRFQVNTRYLLKVDIGRPADSNPVSWAGGGILLGTEEGPFSAMASPTDILPGQFRTLELSYSVAPGDTVIGKSISVMLNAGASPVHFDNLRLEAVPLAAPPATIAPAVEVAWMSRLDEYYRIERATRLTNPDWTSITGILHGTGERMFIFDLAADRERFYRIVPVPPQ